MEKKAPKQSLPPQKLSTQVWVMDDGDRLFCLDNGNCIYVEQLVLPGSMYSIKYHDGTHLTRTLFQFNTEDGCKRKFEWLKTILLSSE